MLDLVVVISVFLFFILLQLMMIMTMHHWHQLKTLAFDRIHGIWIQLAQAILKHSIVDHSLSGIGIYRFDFLLVHDNHQVV
jgi:hypothetical protein